MTGEELAKNILEYVKGIAPDATVVVYATTESDGDEDETLAVMNASPYDMATAVHMATDRLLEGTEVLLNRIESLKRVQPVERPS